MKKNIKILIVEDELIAAEFLSIMLQKEGYGIVGICESGEESILMAGESKPDVIFMDIYLKGQLSGCEAALQIVSKIQTKIIFLSAYSDNEMLQYAMSVGAVNYLIKPYKEAQILVALNLALMNQTQNAKPFKDVIELAHSFNYNSTSNKFYKADNEVKLGGKGLEIIAYLCKRKEHIISTSELSRHIYGAEKNSSTIRALIFRIKQKLACDIIENISGLGYKIALKK